jgi:hypothetical protein
VRGISIYPPGPLPLVKEGGIFTNRIVLIVSFVKEASAANDEKVRRLLYPTRGEGG